MLGPNRSRSLNRRDFEHGYGRFGQRLVSRDGALRVLAIVFDSASEKGGEETFVTQCIGDEPGGAPCFRAGGKHGLLGREGVGGMTFVEPGPAQGVRDFGVVLHVARGTLDRRDGKARRIAVEVQAGQAQEAGAVRRVAGDLGLEGSQRVGQARRAHQRRLPMHPCGGPKPQRTDEHDGTDQKLSHPHHPYGRRCVVFPLASRPGTPDTTTRRKFPAHGRLRGGP